MLNFDMDIVESCNSLLKKFNGDSRKAKKQIIRTLTHRQLLDTWKSLKW